MPFLCDNCAVKKGIKYVKSVKIEITIIMCFILLELGQCHAQLLSLLDIPYFFNTWACCQVEPGHCTGLRLGPGLGRAQARAHYMVREVIM
jgi:hypothetical protein